MRVSSRFHYVGHPVEVCVRTRVVTRGYVRTRGCRLAIASTPLLGLMLVLGCESTEPTPPPPPPQPVATVVVGPSTWAGPVGSGIVLSAFTYDASGMPLDRAATWATSTPTVAVVSPDGAVTVLAEGTATITATSEMKSGTAAIEVWSLVFSSVSAGYGYTCGVTTAGLDACWGLNPFGELGTGTSAYDGFIAAVPALVTGDVTFAAVSAGGSDDSRRVSGAHTCGVTATGAAYCWGSNYFGELGNGSTTGPTLCGNQYIVGPCAVTPVAVHGGIMFAAVSAGHHHTCGVTFSGAAYCWGLNLHGELGNGTTTDRDTPALVAGGVNFVAVSAGGNHTCGVTAAGGAYCWGLNANGQLGLGTTLGAEICNDAGEGFSCSRTPVAVHGGLSFGGVSAGRSHTCGVTTSGIAYCWGNNLYGKLGDGTTIDRDTTALVTGGVNFISVSAGYDHTCGVTTAGVAYCWGNNINGGLGDGTTNNRDTPAPVVGGLSFTAVSAGGSNTCGVTLEGAAYCWGYGVSVYRGLWDWTATERHTPTRVGQ